MSSKMILAEDQEYSLDCYETKLNNNVLVVGGSGAGKTTSIVIPNLMEATGSYIVTDPKGNLYKKLGSYMRSKGYKVLSLDLSDPNGKVRYNFLDYIKTEHDVIKVAHILMSEAGAEAFHAQNAFFYCYGELVIAAALALIMSCNTVPGCPREAETFNAILKACANILDTEKIASLKEDDADGDKWFELFQRLVVTVEGQFSSETASSILSTIGSVIGKLNTVGVERMMTSRTASFDIAEIGLRKTALFVRISDTDRSMDTMANIFFTQAMDVLCQTADKKCTNESLPLHVRFIMDDFATNCTIEDFPRMISSIRSRNISTMLILQAESQLKNRYKEDGETVISNCDTYIYLGGNDMYTAEKVSRKANVPLHKILYMPVGTNWIFRRGQEPKNCKNYDGLSRYKREIEDKKTTYIKMRYKEPYRSVLIGKHNDTKIVNIQKT